MNERLTKIRTNLREFWSSRTKTQKITYVSSSAAVIVLAALLTFFLSRTEFVPLYSDVSRAEIGRIKEQLDATGVKSQVAPGGTQILVPRERVDDLLVTLAAEGFPTSGTIDYSIFSENAGFGSTDNEFNMLKLASMQTELANLIKGIQGVQDANVMITLPAPSVFMSDAKEEASASIILKTDAGHKFTEPQINSLYNLVSKSLPNLPTDNIFISNQYFDNFDLRTGDNGFGQNVGDQMAVKKTIERDLQRQVQMMLGTMMGADKVVVSVTTDIDFQLENRKESLVTPVDEESMAGIALSVQRLTETFSGNGAGAGGVPEAEDPTDTGTGFVEGQFSNGDYEKIEETINNEVNRISKEIVESPYKIRDIGIQVMVEPPTADDPASMPAGVTDDVQRILQTIIRTSIDKESAGELTDDDLNNKIVVSVQTFNSKANNPLDSKSVMPWWGYVIGGVLLLIIGVLVFLFFRKRRKEQEMEDELIIDEQITVSEIDELGNEVETEGTIRRKQLEKMAKDKPEEFAKLLRTWIADE